MITSVMTPPPMYITLTSFWVATPRCLSLQRRQHPRRYSGNLEERAPVKGGGAAAPPQTG